LTNNAVDYKIAYAPPDAKKNIWLNICRPLINTLCGSGVAGCQQWDPNNSGGKASLGTAASQSFAWGQQLNGETGLMLKYTGGGPINNVPRNMEIDFNCDPNTQIGYPVYVTESTATITFYFTWNTSLACGSGCANQPNCSTCTDSAKCMWCLDDNQCAPESQTGCKSFITNPKYCPLDQCTQNYDTCDQCASDSQCCWCLDSNTCYSNTNMHGCGNQICASTFCPDDRHF